MKTNQRITNLDLELNPAGAARSGRVSRWKWPAYLSVLAVAGLLLFASALIAQEAASKKKLTEAALQNLIELQDDDVVLPQLRMREWVFTVDEAFLGRMKQAGASAAVLAELKSRGQKPADGIPGNYMVFAKRDSSYHDASLHTELYINGALVDVFAGEAQKSVSKFLRPGENTILLKTKPNPRSDRLNPLWFKLGPVEKNAEGEPEMQPLWSFTNGSDWSYEKGRHQHLLGPNVREISVTCPLHFAGRQDLEGELAEGDFVLNAWPDSEYYNTSVAVDVSVNGTPLTTFGLVKRNVIITSLLKKGRNEIKVRSRRVDNSAKDNDVHLQVTGYATYDRSQQKYETVPMLTIEAHSGWYRDQRTLRLVSRSDQKADVVERVIPFHLDQDPAAREAGPDPIDEPQFMLWSHRDSTYYEASLYSEVRLNGELVDVFTSNTRKAIGKLIRPGANTITVTTSPQATASGRLNSLHFVAGYVSRDKNNALQMSPLWSFYNSSGWDVENERHVHALGRDTKEVTVTYPLYFAGAESLGREVKDGEYVLRMWPDSEYYTTSVAASVSVNGTPLNSFLHADQQIVITPYLKQGLNEITFVSQRLPNVTRDNDLLVQIGGPAKFDLATQKYQYKPILNWSGLDGWQRNAKSLQLESKTDPNAETIETKLSFNLNEDPAK